MYPPDTLIRENLREAHSASWQRIAEPGSFWRGRERISMVAEARAALACSLCAERKAALSPHAASGDHQNSTDLDPVMIDAIHRMRTDPGRLTKSWFDAVIAGGVSQQAYVEMVSVVNSSVIIDTLHCALGLDLPELPTAVEGEPSGDYNLDAVDDGAWLPVLAAEQVVKAETRMPTAPYIGRAMGLVPSAVALFFQTFRPHYALIDIPLALSQAQAEFIAARTSALNECFYWTASHTMLLRVSGERDDTDYDLGAVTRDSGDTGVLHSDWLRKLTEATIAGEWQALEELRRDAAAVLGAQQTTDVLTVAAAFNGITRVADATGIPLDDNTADTTAELRASTGIDDFAYAAKSARYG